MRLEPNRLFFALWPDDAVRAAIAEAARKLRMRMQPGGYLARPERYHLTLLFLGDAVPARDEAAAIAAAAQVRVAPFTLQLDHAGSFRNRHIPWWLGSHAPPAQLHELHDRLREVLRQADVSIDRMRFVPHLTILREARQPLPPTAIAPVEWPVTEFVLVRSRLDLNPVEYEVIGRWPLRPGDGAPPLADESTGQLALPL
ncbi:RNA 2',3'-cyclic phosphodiesterase [Fontimonas sp. SYSU GA230001]|uniref:RNA 2',3'-cyclic phosphodiesterase n=1 Tax=Fontimonas sp. SYSU GA230001 TaxID=3142450 RepID=UPI0032B4FE87